MVCVERGEDVDLEDSFEQRPAERLSSATQGRRPIGPSPRGVLRPPTAEKDALRAALKRKMGRGD